MYNLDLLQAVKITEADLPDAPGCYVLVADPQAVHELGLKCEAGPAGLYVGKAEDSIHRRVFGGHLLENRSGSSTHRRSVGALLRKQLRLSPQPRSDNPKDRRRFKNYKFDPAGEVKLSKWIAAHVRVVAIECLNPKATEDRLICELRPPLNLTGWPNPDRPMIKEARRECAGLAEEAA